MSTYINKGTSINIPTKLLEKAKAFYNTEKNSVAITKPIEEFILLNQKDRKIDDTSLYQIIPNPADERNKINVPFRLRKEYDNYIMSLTEKSRGCAISSIIARMIDIPLSLTDAIDKPSNERLIYVHGNKYNSNMQLAISRILEDCLNNGKRWAFSVETCAGALGIHAKHHNTLRKLTGKLILNDFDHNKMNLYETVQKYPSRLKAICLLKNVDENTFSKEKEFFSKDTIEMASRYLYLNLLSHRGGGTSFRGLSQEAYENWLDMIYPFHLALKDVTLTNLDIFRIISKYYRKSEKTLFVVDPPYIETAGYCGTDFGHVQHEQLSKKLIEAVSNGHDFIYFCRTTATHCKDKNRNNKDSASENQRKDVRIQRIIGNLYQGHKLYFFNIPTSKDTTERIITSFPFSGSTLYEGGNY